MGFQNKQKNKSTNKHSFIQKLRRIQITDLEMQIL